MAHPILMKIAYFLGDQPIAAAQLCAAHLNHCCSALADPDEQIMIELADRFELTS
jgi:hypothetical protein